ncbi:MAG TPA: hypothetical protein VKR06_40310 [Ktedonosporobacter sp.]|nr:hypothetical protein [Ktedonosporobacter sp.]
MSEVARLMRLIELECEAMQLAMNGYAVVAAHELINQKYRNIGALEDQLAILVGEKEAEKIACEAYIQVIG